MKTIIKNIPHVIWGVIKFLLIGSIGSILLIAVCAGLASPLTTYVYIYGDGAEYIGAGYIYFSSVIGIILYSVTAYVLFRPETEKEIADREQGYHDALMEIIKSYPSRKYER